MRRRFGFTLLEIMIVIVIMGALAAVAMPRMKGTYYGFRIRKAGRDVAGLLRYARNAAVLREKPCEVQFDPEKDTYQLFLFDDQGERIDPTKTRSSRSSWRKKADSQEFVIGDDASGVRRLPAGVHFVTIYSMASLSDDTKLPRVVYYADGSATAATLAIQDDHDLTISVQVYSTTGMTRVDKGLPPSGTKTRPLYYGPNAAQ